MSNYRWTTRAASPWLWPEAAGFELRHGLRRVADDDGDELYVTARIFTGPGTSG